MTTLSVTLPNSIHRHIQEMADMDGVPINQFVLSAVTEKISALTAARYLDKRADRADPGALQAVLNKVPQRTPLAGDE
jgi:cob(I)alamin adenosyltransferase